MLNLALRRALAPLAGVAVLAGGAALPAEAATRTVCTGVAGCHVVKYADIDGDGRADQVGMIARNVSQNGTITVRVRTATGRVLQTTDTKVWWGATPSIEAARIDGVRGTELVVTDGMGAHLMSFRFITYRKGRLVTLAAPKAEALDGDTSRWFIDSSYSFNHGVYRTVSRGVITLTIKDYTRDGANSNTGTITTYGWSNTRGWVQRARSVKHGVPDRIALNGTGGWHISGLPVFPRF
ncbi:MAG: hypothetical protein ACXVYY_08535 [Oryzihumus sp.]